MSERRKVYVIQELPGTKAGTPKINIMSAREYGEFTFLLPEFSQIIFSPGPLVFKLKKLLKYYDIVNLGINKGTVKDIVRALRAYSIKFTDLKNQLIIIQTPDLKNDKLFSKIIGKGIEHSTKELLDINGEDDFGFLEKNKDVVNFNKL